MSGTNFALRDYMDIRKQPPTLAPRKKIFWIGGAIAILILAGLAWLQFHPAIPKLERSKLWLDRVQAGTFVHDIRANGTLVPREIRWLAAGTVGTVSVVKVQAGARVRAGDAIITLTNPTIQSALAKSKSALVAATADAKVAEVNARSHRLDLITALAQAKSDFETTSMQHQSLEAAFKGGAASEVSLKENAIKLQAQKSLLQVQQQRLHQFDAALGSQYQAATAHRDEAAISVQLAEQDIANLIISSPVDGTLQQVTAEPGQQLAAGTIVAKVATEGNMVARLQVPEADAKDLILGLRADLAVGGEHVSGTVGRIDPAVTNGYVSVDVVYEQSALKYARPDLSVIGSIVIATVPNTITISRPSGASANTSATLFVIAKGANVAQKRTVRFGVASTQRIQVLNGLSEGDEVILSDMGENENKDILEVN